MKPTTRAVTNQLDAAMAALNAQLVASASRMEQLAVQATQRGHTEAAANARRLAASMRRTAERDD